MSQDNGLQEPEELEKQEEDIPYVHKPKHARQVNIFYRGAEVAVGILFMPIGFITGNLFLGIITGAIGFYLIFGRKFR